MKQDTIEIKLNEDQVASVLALYFTEKFKGDTNEVVPVSAQVTKGGAVVTVPVATEDDPE